MTRRGVLSMVSQVFYPWGLISPFVSIGRRLVQEIVQEQRSWDDVLDESMVLQLGMVST